MAVLRIDWRAVDHMLNSPTGMVGQNCQQRADRTAARARQFAPGSMSERIAPPVVQPGPGGPSADITVRHHAVGYVINGTGIYGPSGQRIRPVRAQALRFVLNGRVVFAKSVSGQKPNDFMNRALPTAL